MLSSVRQLRQRQPTIALMLLLLTLVIQCEISACYRNEIEITPAPPGEQEITTKKSGWFGGIKNFFRGSDTTTTTSTTTLAPPTQSKAAAPMPNNNNNIAKPPPLVISHAPLMPLGPRPDTPSSSPFGSNQQQEPQWPTVGQSTSANINQNSQQQRTGATPSYQPSPQSPVPLDLQRPGVAASNQPTALAPIPSGLQRPNVKGMVISNLPPGFAPYTPPKIQPSGFELSYGGGGSHAQSSDGLPGFGLTPLTSSTTTTSTTTAKSVQQSAAEIYLRGSFDVTTSKTITRRPQTAKDEYTTLPPSRQPSIKDYPALPTLKTPIPNSPLRPSAPSAWNSPLPTPSTSAAETPLEPSSPMRPNSPIPSRPTTAYVPHVPSAATSTTVRPGYQQNADNSLATDDEIRQLTEQLYNKETNSQLNHITVKIQGKTRSIDSTDEAPEPLLSVDLKALEANTIAKLRVLFNNYEQDTLVNEHVTAMERREENEFLDAVMATPVMRHTMQFLQQKGIVSPDPKTHRNLVKELWFTQYSRGQGKIGSSGFEHVFVHEVKEGTIIGFHNWVYINEEEKAGRFDYKGYLQQLDLGMKGKVLKIRFSHNGLNKPVDTMFVGTSPELELALYTLCFQLRPDRTCPVSLGNSKFGIVTYSWRYRGKSLIGSAYPEI